MAKDFLSQEFHEDNDEIFKPISPTKRKTTSFPAALVKALVATTTAVTAAAVLWGNIHISCTPLNITQTSADMEVKISDRNEGQTVMYALSEYTEPVDDDNWEDIMTFAPTDTGTVDTDRTVLSFDNLKPGTSYTLLFCVTDSEGNLIPDEVRYFTTAGTGGSPAPSPQPTAEGGATDTKPTPKPTSQPTSAPEVTPSPTPASTPTPAVTPVPTATAAPTATPAPTSTPDPTETPAPTATPSPAPAAPEKTESVLVSVTDGSGNAFVAFKLNDTDFADVTSMDVHTVFNYVDPPSSPPLEYTENYDPSMLVEDGGNVLASHYFDLAAGLSIEMTPTLNFNDSNGTAQSVTGDVFRVAPYFFYQNLPNSTIAMASSYPAVQDNAPYTFTVSADDIYQGSDKFQLYNISITAYNTGNGDYYEEDVVLDREYTPGEDITISGTLPLSTEGEYTVTFEIDGSWNVEGFGDVMYSSAYTQHNVTVGSAYTVNLPSVEAAGRYGLSVSQPMLSLTLDDSSFTAGPIEAYAGGDVYVRYTLGGTPAADPADPAYDPLHDYLFYANITVPHAEFDGRTVAIQQTSTYSSSYPAEFFVGSSEETRYMYFVFTMPSADIPAGAVKATEITITSTP